MLKNLAFLMLGLIMSGHCHAQETVNGQVVDSLTGKGLYNASVMLRRNGKTLMYTKTDKNGHFSLRMQANEKDSLQTVMMGYAKRRIAVRGSSPLLIRLSQQVFTLREVKVEGNVIGQRKDTISYDLTQYTGARDNTLKDVLKKLPGVEVAESGEISVNGKKLSRFTVEGLDLSKGKYNKLTDNIRAKDVKKAEVINHDQPIKALRNRVFTDDVAMNIQLKDSARDRIVLTLRPYVLVGSPTHVGGDATAMQIGKKKQMEYVAQYDRSGRDINQANSIFYILYGMGNEATLPQWFSVPSLATPIDANRLRFNTSQAYSIDRLAKSSDDAENSISISYNRSVTRQHTVNRSRYDMNDSTISTAEDKYMTLKNDEFTLDYHHTINADKHFGNANVKVTAAQSDGYSQMTNGDMPIASQRVRIPEVNAKANIQQTYTLGKGQLAWNSLIDYHHSQNALYINKDKIKYDNNLWHTFHSLGYNRNAELWNWRIRGEVEAENLNVVKDNWKLGMTLSPGVSFKDDNTRFYVNVPLTAVRYTRQQESLLLPSPSIGLYQDFNFRNSLNLNVNYAERAASWTSFAMDSLQLDYRTFQQAADFIPRTKTLTGNLNYQYKRPILHFFADATLTGGRTWNNMTSDLQISNGKYKYTFLKHRTHHDFLNGTLSLSKGIFPWHLKTSLDITGSLVRGEQYSAGGVNPFHYRSLSFQPGILFSPTFMEVDYNGTFSISRSKVGDQDVNSLFDWKQQLGLTSTIQHVDLSLTGILYHNELQDSPSVNTLLVDADMTWRMKNLRLKASLHNLFNKKQYTQTHYSGVGIFTDEYELRPREFLVSLQFSL